MNCSEIWATIQSSFPILNSSFTMYDNVDWQEAEFSDSILLVIKTMNLTNVVQSLVFTRTEDYIRQKVAVEFWSYFQKPLDSNNGFMKFTKAVDLLYKCYLKFLPSMAKLDLLQKNAGLHNSIYNEKNAHDALGLSIRAILLSQLPVSHKTIIEHFYETALKKEENKNIENHGDDGCTVCLLNNENECACLHNFYETNRKLAELGLLEPMAGQVLTSLIYSYVESHIQKVCKDSFDTSYIKSLQKWLDSVVISWLQRIYCYDGHYYDRIDKFSKKLVNFLYETYTKIRINQLFNIIIEYPESSPALEDLRITISSTDLRPVLTQKLQKAMETRLLHPGVSTQDILTAYIATIRSMRILDPSGLLLETITQPVHQYLRRREDTVRCVVASLTEEGPNDLADELVRNEAIQIDVNTASDEDADNWANWMPDPVDADPLKSFGQKRTSDIISMLVSVYGSKELFINEYRTLLADRLLSQFSCDTEKEIRYLELLKLRFGDLHLHNCEVVLKDVQNSKRINQHIKQDSDYVENIPLSSMIVSAQFWPAFKEEKLELHPTITEQMQQYTKAFEMLKGSRTLYWKNHLGMIDLEIELENRIINLSVNPVQATIIMHFQDKAEWTLDELSRIMQVPPTVLRKKIRFWQSHGLLVEKSTNVFLLVEEQDDTQMSHAEIMVEDYESESAMASVQDQREEELQTFWSYIVGMLTNLDSLSLERIHQMLKMFAFQGPVTECSMQELRAFLDKKVREHQLTLCGGLYKLPKP